MGDIGIELFPGEAPKTVENFVELAKKKYYNEVIFHRVIENFMIQGAILLELDAVVRALGG